MEGIQREGIGESPLPEVCKPLLLVARDDRDGCSRYRVSKMPLLR